MKKLLLVLLVFVVGAASAQGPLRNRRAGAGAPAAGGGAKTEGGGEAFASAAKDDEAQTSDLNFRNADLDQVFLTYGRLVERTVLKDPGTPNLTLTFQSRKGQKLTKEQQIEAIEVLLEMHGIHFENYGEKFVRALPRKDARKEGIPLYLDIDDPEIAATPEGRVISVNLAFKNISTEEAQKALEGFKSNNGLLQVFERTNSIVVTDTKQNIARMAQIAKMIDIATPVMEIVEVVQIKNASATEVQAALQKIVEDAMKYQEKDGKAQQNAQNSRASLLSSRPTSSFLRRPGQNQPEPPKSVESLITSVSDADRGMIRGRVLIVPDERSNKLIIVTNKSNMDFFRKVIAALDVETTPDTVVKVYRLKYADAEEVSDMINDLIGNSANSSKSSRANQNQNAKKGVGGNLTRGTTSTPRAPANQRSGDPKAGELSKDNTTVLADKRINGLVVMTQKELVPTIEEIIESMDIKLSQVLIETVIIEVGLGDDILTGIDWVNNRWTGNQHANVMGGGGGGTEITKLSSLTKNLKTFNEYLNDAQQLKTHDDTAEEIIAIAKSLQAEAKNDMANDALQPTGAGINYFLKANKLNLSAIISAVKTDTHSKYIASPIIMTLDNKEAIIEATEMRYLFKGYQYSGSSSSGTSVPDYEQKELGITIKVTPKINPNGTVMLKIEEEYSQEGSGQSITSAAGNDLISAATTVTRKLSADALLEDGQTVIFGGLTESVTTEKTTGIPILKDIPYIGKWLFGTVDQKEGRKELLVFMTPYVLNDSEAAQAEALRRKRSISDPRPWDDHGWSASELADPVSKKEALRRLKEEAKKQDEERKTRLAIEKWKLDRAKSLEEMDESERKFWIEAHREELEKEEKEKFDKKMKEQADLKLLATQIREKRLEKANEKIDENAKDIQSENERGRLEKEKSKAVTMKKAAKDDSSLLSDLEKENRQEKEETAK